MNTAQIFIKPFKTALNSFCGIRMDKGSHYSESKQKFILNASKNASSDNLSEQRRSPIHINFI